MRMRSGLGLVLVTWVTAAATLTAAWRTPGPHCACAAPAAVHPTCCCSAPKAESCCAKATAHKSCCHPAPAPTQAGRCGCSAPAPGAPAVPPRPAGDLDELGPLAVASLDAPGSALPHAGHPAYGSLAHPAPPPPIDLTVSLSRLTC